MAPVRIEITEDATSGISIRLHNNGRFPDLLKGYPKHIVRRATPWLWNSYERRVIVKARSLTWQGRRLVRQMLIAERARALMEQNLQPKRVGWLGRQIAARAAGRAGATRAAAVLPKHQLTAQVREVAATGAKARIQAEAPARSSGPVRQEQGVPRLTERAEGPRADVSLAEQLVRAGQSVATRHQDGDRETPKRDAPLHEEVARLGHSEPAEVRPETGPSLAEQMLATSALKGLRVNPLPREDGQQRSR